MVNVCKKIGVLAFSSCTNYGGMLQVYALQEMLVRMGYIPTVLDLWPIPNNKYLYGALHNPYVGWVTRFKAFKKALFNRRFRWYERRYIAFQQWQKAFLKMSTQVWRTAAEFANNPPDVDLLEVGSDQVFNKNVASLFLCADVSESLPRISYGASFGSMEKDEKELQRLKEGLAKFKGVAAREKVGAKLVESLLGDNVPWVVDPTLLIGRTFWKNWAKRYQTDWKGGVVYWLGDVKPLRERIEVLRAKYNKPIKLFLAHYDARLPLDMEGVDIQWDASPTEFVTAIAQADYVVSNSFHAMMFSILFGKRAAFMVGGERIASATRFTDIAMIARCEAALYLTWPTAGLELFDLTPCYDACHQMILDSRKVLKQLCEV